MLNFDKNYGLVELLLNQTACVLSYLSLVQNIYRMYQEYENFLLMTFLCHQELKRYRLHTFRSVIHY